MKKCLFSDPGDAPVYNETCIKIGIIEHNKLDTVVTPCSLRIACGGTISVTHYSGHVSSPNKAVIYSQFLSAQCVFILSARLMHSRPYCNPTTILLDLF